MKNAKALFITVDQRTTATVHGITFLPFLIRWLNYIILRHFCQARSASFVQIDEEKLYY